MGLRTGYHSRAERDAGALATALPAAAQAKNSALPLDCRSSRLMMLEAAEREPNGQPGVARAPVVGILAAVAAATVGSAVGNPVKSEARAAPTTTRQAAGSNTTATATAAPRRRRWPPAPMPATTFSPLHLRGGHPARGAPGAPSLAHTPKPHALPPSAACIPARAERTAVNTPHGICPATVRG